MPNHRRILSVMVATALLVGPGAAAQTPESSASGGSPSTPCQPTPLEPDTELSLVVDGVERTLLLHVPPPTPGARPSLLLAFHGYGGGMWDLGYTGLLSDLADAHGFVAAYPQGIGEGPTWDLQGGSDIPFVLALIDELVATQCVDPSRVFATGFSMGGGMANVLACRHADRIAAIAPVDANHGPTWGDPCEPSRPVPIVAFHGTADEALPYAGGDSPFPDRPVTAVEDWMADWAIANGCTGGPDVAPASSDVDSLTWQGCAAPTQLYRVTGGGHTWPGGQNDPSFGYSTDAISASELMWALFDSVP
ncbi:MAG: hypothetical protein KF809_09295 [Chloroflexi bacterium]|nr:hypothetical protein [Chloroflexota bacterium]